MGLEALGAAALATASKAGTWLVVTAKSEPVKMVATKAIKTGAAIGVKVGTNLCAFMVTKRIIDYLDSKPAKTIEELEALSALKQR